MNITVIGCGYVGLVTGACLAEVGNDAFCLDMDESRINMLRRGQAPIYEPSLSQLILRNSEAGRALFPDMEKRRTCDHA